MFAPFETAVGWFPFAAPEIPIERLVEDGHYVVRAQIPGVATKDIDISVENGVMRISAERSGEMKENARSEFHYGKLLRMVPLPDAANEDTATAKYANGVLEISFTLGEAKGAARHVAIEVDKGTVKQSVKQTVRGVRAKATK
jgi:HSP20 family molecular chaperone IbpA